MPTFLGNSRDAFGVPNIAASIPIRSFQDGLTPLFPQRNYAITGTTYDSTGAALASCSVYVFRTDFGAPLQIPSDVPGVSPVRANIYAWAGTSDGSGIFSAGPFAGNSGTYWAVAWGPTGVVAGVTLQTVVPA
jgi:hypothetical protein